MESKSTASWLGDLGGGTYPLRPSASSSIKWRHFSCPELLYVLLPPASSLLGTCQGWLLRCHEPCRTLWLGPPAPGSQPFKGRVKARWIKARVRNGPFLDRASSALRVFMQKGFSGILFFCHLPWPNVPTGEPRRSRSWDSCKEFNSEDILQQLDGYCQQCP